MTTLLDPDHYPALDLVCAYHERWEIEVLIDEMDTHQRLAQGVLRSQKPVGVIQELYGLLLAHYAMRVLMHEAALQAEVDPDRLSFVHALQVIQDAIPEFQMAAAAQVPSLYRRLLRDIARKRVPERKLRSNPRVVKRKMSKFKLKRPEHAHAPTLDRPFRAVVALQPEVGSASAPEPPTNARVVLILPPYQEDRDRAYVDLRHCEPSLI